MEAWFMDAMFLTLLGLLLCATVAFFAWIKWRDRQRQTGDSSSTIPTDAPPAGRLERHPGGECPICLSKDVISPVQTNCGHWFCANCILAYYDRLGRMRIKCPICRQEVTMLHGAANEGPDRTPPTASSAEDSSTSSEAQARPPSLGSAETQEQIARFNERNSRRRRTMWQVIVDAPLLLRRLVSDLRRGDLQVFHELIRRGVQLKLLVGAFYIFSPVDIIPEGRIGMVIGLLDDVLVALFFLLHITSVYRAMLLSWDRARVARRNGATGTATPGETTAAAAVASGEPLGADDAVDHDVQVPNPGDGFRWQSLEGPGTAAFFAIAVGAMVTFAGAGAGAAGLAAAAAGIVAAATNSANAIPPLARDW